MRQVSWTSASRPVCWAAAIEIAVRVSRVLWIVRPRRFKSSRCSSAASASALDRRTCRCAWTSPSMQVESSSTAASTSPTSGLPSPSWPAHSRNRSIARRCQPSHAWQTCAGLACPRTKQRAVGLARGRAEPGIDRRQAIALLEEDLPQGHQTRMGLGHAGLAAQLLDQPVDVVVRVGPGPILGRRFGHHGLPGIGQRRRRQPQVRRQGIPQRQVDDADHQRQQEDIGHRRVSKPDARAVGLLKSSSRDGDGGRGRRTENGGRRTGVGRRASVQSRMAG